MAFVLIIPFVSSAEEYPFDPSHVISDATMFDYDSMNIGDIQNFLQIKGSMLAWTITEDYEGNMKTAAEIIYLAANEYRVNPKLLLAFLQKEQSLITLENPNQGRFDWAMGYAVCDSCRHDDPKIQKYKGFGKQVDHAAGAMRFYTDKASTYGYVKSAGENVTIDGQNFVLENQATANLYTYTPHIWGNELFSHLYNKYFESPLAGENTIVINPIVPEVLAPPVVVAPIVRSNKYKLEVLGHGKDEIWANENEEAYYWVEYKNSGQTTWFNQDLNNLYLVEKTELASSIIPKITDNSLFNNAGVLQSLNLIKAATTEVKPGGILRVTIKIDPSYVKTESFDYLLVLGGHGYFPESELNFKLTRVFNYDAQLISHNYPNSSTTNQAHEIDVLYKNVGNRAWTKEDITLEWSNITKDTANMISMDEAIVNPGETANFHFTTNVTASALYEYSLKLFKDVGSKYNLFPTGSVFPKIAVGVDTNVDNSNLALTVPINTSTNVSNTVLAPVETVDDSSFTYGTSIGDGSFSAQIVSAAIPVGLAPGEIRTALITFKNTGKKVWLKDEMVLRSYKSTDPFRGSDFYNAATWLTSMAVGKVKYDVKPGDSYTFTFNLHAPTTVGAISHYWQLEWGNTYQEIPIDGNLTKGYITFVQ